MYMYVCIYVCMHVCMHACMYVCIYVCKHVCLYMYLSKRCICTSNTLYMLQIYIIIIAHIFYRATMIIA